MQQGENNKRLNKNDKERYKNKMMMMKNDVEDATRWGKN